MSWSGACNDTAKFTWGRSLWNLLIAWMIPTCIHNVRGWLTAEFTTAAPIIKKNQYFGISDSFLMEASLIQKHYFNHPLRPKLHFFCYISRCTSKDVYLDKAKTNINLGQRINYSKKWQNTPWFHSQYKWEHIQSKLSIGKLLPHNMMETMQDYNTNLEAAIR